jgi:glutathione S-transferase
MLNSWFQEHKRGAGAIQRSAEAQQTVDAATRNLAFYYYDSCYFCRRVLRAMAELALNIERRNIMENPEHRAELMTEGGSSTVPCLRIDADDGAGEWLYESKDICRYLNARFGAC